MQQKIKIMKKTVLFLMVSGSVAMSSCSDSMDLQQETDLSSFLKLDADAKSFYSADNLYPLHKGVIRNTNELTQMVSRLDGFRFTVFLRITTLRSDVAWEQTRKFKLSDLNHPEWFMVQSVSGFQGFKIENNQALQFFAIRS